MAPPPAKMQEIHQFLSSALTQRGPTALPYAEPTKSLIRQHLLNLVSSHTSLDPKTATFTHNDGRSVILLQADGTVPMPFQGVSYNIPVVIWLLDSYPHYPPCVYVNPTRDMIIKRPHSNVSPSGLVSLPYLQNWVYPSSNLVDLAAHLSAAFSRDPPLYSQRRPPPPQPQPSPSIGSGYSRSSRLFTPPHQTDDAAEVYKKNAINKLVDRVHCDLVLMRSAREVEAEGLLSLQSGLERREEEINNGLNEMVNEKETLEQQLQVIAMNTEFLDTWIRENQGKPKNLLVDLEDVDDAFDCIGTLSKQMLECTSLDLAIEDVVYSMDKSFQDGSLPFDQYLRNVRLLSREQFFHRATAEKVRELQMDAQVASIAARLHS
ncbi:PREDICTED: protein ELC-like [Camelina sativa]|uniref:Protein ELC-like n=1 Tax=Camelina sativa TaxID=90675 RepID=A0ABM0T2M7_CAMSA|nr:PREDICTED: protein ELC-like [Camelina sativa]